MIETKYALQKFVEARQKTCCDDKSTKFLFNLETTTAFQNRQSLFDAAVEKLDGCVLDRVDYTGSLDMSRDSIKDDVVTADVCEAAALSKSNDVEMVVGGGVFMDSFSALRTIRDRRLTRYETRKNICPSGALDLPRIEQGFGFL